MENIIATINKKTRKVYLSKSVIGNDGENLQEKFIFKFNDEFVNGTARIELQGSNKEKSYIMLTKVNETYELPVRSVITKVGRLDMQLVITEGTNDEEIPIFKSNVFFVIVNESINAETIQEDEYPDFIDRAETKLNQMDNLDIDAEQTSSGATITITKKDGTEESVNITNGTDGIDGQDGISPIATVTQNTGSATISITDKNGTTTATINDGQRGTDGVDGITPTIGDNGNWYLGSTDTGKPSRGIQGETGQTGATGQDGISPVVTTSKSGNTTTITITDKIGEHTATVVDGIDGTDGRDGYVQYTAGDNITIENNVISASGGGEKIEINKSTYNEPYVLSDMKKGIYYVYGAGWYKETSSSTRTSYINTTNYGNYCIPFIIILNKDVSEATENEEFGYVILRINSDTSSPGTFMASGTMWIAKIKKVSTFFQIKQYVYGEWVALYQILIDGNPQTIRGVKTFASIPKIDTYTAPTTDTQLVAKKYIDDNINKKQDIIQYSTMPTATSNDVGKIVQYTGTTDSTYTNGYFYIGTENNNTYSWESINVQPGSSGGEQEVFTYTKSTSSNPLRLDLLKTGIYLYNPATPSEYLYYKVKEDYATKYISTYGTILFMQIVKQQSEITSSNDVFGYIYYVDSINNYKLTVKSLKYNYTSGEFSNVINAGTTTVIENFGLLSENAQAIKGLKTFSILPKVNTYSAPTTDTELAPKKYVDDSIASAITTTLNGNY